MKTICLIFTILAGLALTASVNAAPSCDKNPDHPSCSGGGGGGGGGEDPAANPALVYYDGRDSIDVVDADGSNATVVLGDIFRLCTRPKWSPDGSQMAFGQTGEVYVMNSDGTALADLSSESVDWSGACALDWSQGAVLGTEDLIAFVGIPAGLSVGFPDETDYDDVYLLDPDTGAVSNLTDSFGISEQGVAWSHDGQSLAVVRTSKSNFDDQSLVILNLVIEIDGTIGISSEVNITPTTVPFAPWNDISWASTSNQVLFTSNGDLFAASFDASGLSGVTQFTGGPGQFNLAHENAATSSPQDDFIAFVVSGGGKKENGIYRMELATGTAEKVVSGQGTSIPAWPDWKPTWTASP